jgi:hypothetical protein
MRAQASAPESALSYEKCAASRRAQRLGNDVHIAKENACQANIGLLYWRASDSNAVLAVSAEV